MATDAIIVFGRLSGEGEGVDVRRPVRARPVSASTHQLDSDPAPAEEVWSYRPGEIVVAEPRMLSEGRVLVAVAKATGFDARSVDVAPLAG